MKIKVIRRFNEAANQVVQFWHKGKSSYFCLQPFRWFF